MYAGNGTFEAATLLGWKQIAVVWFDSESEAKAYALVDNQSAKYSVIDVEATRALLDELEFDPITDAELLSLTDDVLAACDQIEAERLAEIEEDEDDSEDDQAAVSHLEAKIVMRFEEDDIDDIATFLGASLKPKGMGKKLLSRIKKVAAEIRAAKKTEGV